MPLRCSLLSRIALALLLAAPSLSASENRIMGRQSHNTGLPIVPKKAPVVIDGKLEEWDRSGRIWSFADVAVRDEYSVETTAMWDGEALYIAALWRDPTPMVNAIDPDFNPSKGWMADAMQLRISSDKTYWLTTWYYAARQEAILHIETWGEPTSPRNNTVRLLRSKSGGSDLGEGVQIAYRKTDDGRGFVQEMRLPWTLIFDKKPDIAPGTEFNLGLEFIWGNEDGTRPGHRYADNLQPGMTSREFFWTAYKVWGPATVVANAPAEGFKYVASDWQLKGPLPVELKLPKEARRFTVVIESERGEPIRSLGADLSPADYLVREEKDGTQVVSVPWDVRDNAGVIVPPGRYRARGLTHEGLRARYDTSFYNPGTPPWDTANKASGWMADHNSPQAVTTGGDLVFLASRVAEGGSGIIAVGPEGRKIWGEKRGATSMAADGTYLYAIEGMRNQRFQRYNHQGEYQPYEIDGETQPFDFPLVPLIGEARQVTAIAVDAKRLYLATQNVPEEKAPAAEHKPEATLLVLDKATLKPIGKPVPLPATAQAIAIGPKEEIYTLTGNETHRVNVANGKLTLIPTPGVEEAGALAVNAKGELYLFDLGAASQVRAFSPEGKPLRTVGKEGGHLRHGLFDSAGLRDIRSMAFDASGQLWTLARHFNPRRVSVWDEGGKLVRDYIGNTQYGGTGAYFDPTKGDYGYVGSVEMKLDRDKNSYDVTRILWAPDRKRNEAFPLWMRAHWFANPNFIEATHKGKTNRYLYFNSFYGRYVAFYMERDNVWYPVSAIARLDYLKADLPHLPWPGNDPQRTTIFWNDTNRDGAVSLDECEIVSEEIPASGFWGSIPGAGLQLLGRARDGTNQHTPVGFDEDGAPRFNLKGVKLLPDKVRGDFYPLPQDGRVLVIGEWNGQKGIFATSPNLQRMLWLWPTPYNGVHGSHKAPMSRPGLVIGALKWLGFADVNKEVGRVGAIRGNLGEDYYFTSDGLLIGAMFSDTRLPRPGLPETLEEMRNYPLENLTAGGEPFSGWFGKMPDGRILELTSMGRQDALSIEILGLDKVKRFKGGTVTVDEPLRVKAEQEGAQQEASYTPPQYTVKRAPAPLPHELKGWNGIEERRIESPTSAMTGGFRLAYDAENLYIMMRASDPSPWINEGRNPAILFKTGDAFDLQIGPADPANRRDPVEGDQRLVIAPTGEKPTAMLLRPVDPKAPANAAHTYRSPVMEKPFARVAALPGVQITVAPQGDGWLLFATVPLKDLGLDIKSGTRLKADLGFISSDEGGRINTARTYWSNKQTNLVNDEPSEAALHPDRWGNLSFE